MDRETIRGLAERLRQVHLPVCPQMRSGRPQWFQVEGYCASDAAPGRLVFPSIDEFRTHCATGMYLDCPWFGGLRDAPSEVARQQSRVPALSGSPGLAEGRDPGNGV